MASAVQVSTHSRLKAAELYGVLFILIGIVSTHSRPKAAAASSWLPFSWSERFNTQPPEGGWASLKSLAPSGFVAPISLSPQEKREREYNTAFSVIPAFSIS